MRTSFARDRRSSTARSLFPPVTPLSHVEAGSLQSRRVSTGFRVRKHSVRRRDPCIAPRLHCNNLKKLSNLVLTGVCAARPCFISQPPDRSASIGTGRDHLEPLFLPSGLELLSFPFWGYSRDLSKTKEMAETHVNDQGRPPFLPRKSEPRLSLPAASAAPRDGET